MCVNQKMRYRDTKWKIVKELSFIWNIHEYKLKKKELKSTHESIETRFIARHSYGETWAAKSEDNYWWEAQYIKVRFFERKELDFLFFFINTTLQLSTVKTPILTLINFAITHP